MDQIRSFLNVLGKQHFWVLCGTIALVGTGSWIATAAYLDAEYKKYEGEIESSRKGMERLQSQQNHPNAATEKGMEERIARRRDEVREAWAKKYERQVDELRWPAELKKKFIDAVDPLRPIEVAVTYPSTVEILNPELRKRYRDYIDEEMPKLAEIIGAIWEVEESAGSLNQTDSPFGGGSSFGDVDLEERLGYGFGEFEEFEEEIVYWHADSQAEVLQKHFDWSKKREGVPSTLEVLYAQEDLWVLKSLMTIIKNTNGDADAEHNAAIREIYSIHLGKSAAGKVGKITLIAPPRGRGGRGGLQAELGIPTGGMVGGGGGFSAASGNKPAAGGNVSGTVASTARTARPGFLGSAVGADGVALDVDPADWRYVDKNFQPLSGKQLRDAANSKNPEEAYLTVAKGMPIRIRVRMDQRKLNRLLVECSNSKLTVEIQQVRIHSDPGGLGQSTGSFNGIEGMGDGGFGDALDLNEPGAGFGGDEEGEFGLNFGGAYSRQKVSQRSSGLLEEGVEVIDSFPYDVDVELYGIIYIFNPVNENGLGYDKKAAQQAAAQQQQPAAQPAGEPEVQPNQPAVQPAEPVQPPVQPTPPVLPPAG